jgi:hypothetical protein
MRKSILLILFLCLPAIAAYAQSCKFETEGEPRVPGANVQVEMTAGIVSKITGTAFTPSGADPAAGGIVAAFSLKDDKKVFVGWQTLGKDGKFCFGDLPDGKYLLRIGLAGGFNTTNVYLTLDNYNLFFWRKKLKIELTLGT